MAVSKKKKRAGAKTEGVFIECSRCGKAKALTSNFYKSDRPEYAETGYCDVCKSCVKEIMIDENTGMVNRDAFENKICYMLNIPFVPAEYEKLLMNPLVTPDRFYSEYRKIVSINREYKDMRYNDSSVFVHDEAGIVNKKEKVYDQVTPEMIDFWGRGFEAAYYIDVQSRYDKFVESEDLDKMDYKKQSDYKMLCHYERKQIELLQDKNAKPTDLKAVNDMISKLSEDLNIKATQKKQDENDISHYTVGLTAKYIEDVKLEPIPVFNDEDWRGDHSREEFLKLMAYFTAPLLTEAGIQSLLDEIIEEDKKKYTPSQEELDIATLESDDLEVDF